MRDRFFVGFYVMLLYLKGFLLLLLGLLLQFFTIGLGWHDGRGGTSHPGEWIDRDGCPVNAG
ncbi:hypothetical protein [Chitinolyticbacter albus]|uniref:hypothetical protein n=1 Tax=Chitinolyticbacter albus TaxID=2961951 RepID=UPI00210E7C91|nr:hypothetical protein [Chitinolyticbacter albus]